MATITSVKERINQLNPASFQILCDELLSKEGYPNIVSLGTQDGAENVWMRITLRFLFRKLLRSYTAIPLPIYLRRMIVR